MAPGFLNHLFLICQFELKRLFFTRKGLLYLFTFAIVWGLILWFPIRYASGLLEPGRSVNSGSFFAFLGFGSLLNWQIPEFGVYWHFALIIFPILCVIVTADQTSSDRDRGTLRFLALRANRDSIFFGRFIGALTTQLILILMTVFTTLILAVVRDPTLISAVFNSASAITVNLILVLLPFTAMMAALSATFRSSRTALVLAILIWVFLSGIITALSSYLPALETLKFLIPGHQTSELAQLSEWQPLQLAYIPLLQTIVILIIGRWVMVRQTL